MDQPATNTRAIDTSAQFQELSLDELDEANGGSWAAIYNKAVEIVYGQPAEWHAMRIFSLLT